MKAKRSSPLPLQTGDTVGVVAPGFAVRSSALLAGIDRLREWGFEVRLGARALARSGYFSGTDAQRADDLNRMLRDPEVRAVWMARGGYGAARVVERIDWGAYRRAPKLLVGYSDATALFASALRARGSVCLYGPVVRELDDPRSFHGPSLRAALRGDALRLRLDRGRVVREGRAEGLLAGGNLTVLCHLLGTPYEPDLRGRILFLEDVGEEVYRLDRMLTQLRQAGALRDVAGIVLGRFAVPPTRREFPPDRPLSEVFAEVLAPLGVPVIGGLQAGHCAAKRTLPLGTRAILDTGSGVLHVGGGPGSSAVRK